MYTTLLYSDHIHNNPTGADPLQEIIKSDSQGQNPETQAEVTAVGKLIEQFYSQKYDSSVVSTHFEVHICYMFRKYKLL